MYFIDQNRPKPSSPRRRYRVGSSLTRPPMRYPSASTRCAGSSCQPAAMVPPSQFHFAAILTGQPCGVVVRKGIPTVKSQVLFALRLLGRWWNGPLNMTPMVGEWAALWPLPAWTSTPDRISALLQVLRAARGLNPRVAMRLA